MLILLLLFPILHLMNVVNNNKKYYFKYSDYSGYANNSWNFVRKPFNLTFIENDNTLCGQFLTSNWFQISIKINKSYILQHINIFITFICFLRKIIQV